MLPKRAFRKPKTADEEKDLWGGCVPRSTQYVNKWAFKIFSTWQRLRENKDPCLEERGFEVDIEKVQSLETNIINMTAESLNFWLVKFIEEVCKEDGQRYPARSLYSIICGLQRHLQEANANEAISLINNKDRRLSAFRRVLDAEMRDATKEGISQKTKKPEKDGVTEEEEKLLWEKNVLGCQTAKSLVNTIYFYNGKLFGLRANEHRNLRFSSIKVESNSILYEESISKTYHGGLKDLRYNPRRVRHVCCKEPSKDHFPCLVNCYAKYLENIKHLAEKVDAFYFKPHSNSEFFRYDKCPIGINTLNKMLPEMMLSAGLPKKTSHNLRVTCATRLFQDNVDEKLIRERTGHRSSALFKYENTSEIQEKRVSDILGPPEKMTDDLIDLPEIDVDICNEVLGNIDLPDSAGSQISKDHHSDIDFEISDEFLANISLPVVTSASTAKPPVNTSMTNCVFNNCSIHFVGTKPEN